MLSGVPFVTLVLTLPGRFQSVNGESALGAGLKILPFTLLVAFGSIVTGALTAKGRVSAFRVLTLGTLLQCSGVGLLYSVSVELAPSSRLYGFQVLAGLGTGLSLTTLLNMVPFVMTTKSKLGKAREQQSNALVHSGYLKFKRPVLTSFSDSGCAWWRYAAENFRWRHRRCRCHKSSQQYRQRSHYRHSTTRDYKCHLKQYLGTAGTTRRRSCTC